MVGAWFNFFQRITAIYSLYDLTQNEDTDPVHVSVRVWGFGSLRLAEFLIYTCCIPLCILNAVCSSSPVLSLYSELFLQPCLSDLLLERSYVDLTIVRTGGISFLYHLVGSHVY